MGGSLSPGLSPALNRHLSAVVRRFGLGAVQHAAIEALLGCLSADARAPTSVTDPALALDRHVADSLVALDLPAVRGARAVADLGSGAGFPGLPLAIALPGAGVTLVESSGRKCAFLRTAVAACKSVNTAVAATRAEDWPQGVEAHDLVVARALAPLPVVLEYAAPLLHADGVVVVWRGARRPDEERSGAEAARLLGLESAGIVPVTPFRGAHSRHLALYVKVRPTPPDFPRRPGIARKTPLGANSKAERDGQPFPERAGPNDSGPN